MKGLARKGLLLQVAASKLLKTAEIAFIHTGDGMIFLPTKEVRYTPRSRLFSRLEPCANELNAHTGIILPESKIVF